MKKVFITLAAAAVLLAACTKSVGTKKNEVNSQVFDSWLHINGYEGNETVADGIRIYVLDEQVGAGKSVGKSSDHPYVSVEYNLYDLEGTVITTSYEDVAKRVGTYTDDGTYYGPYIWVRKDNGLYAGVEYMLERMKVGGRLKCVIPGWYQSNDRYSSDAEYMANAEGTDYIYEIKVKDVIDDVAKWELDSLDRFVTELYPSIDTLDKDGVYYRRFVGPKSDKDTLVVGKSYNINYIGRLLNGQVFDTNIADTATFYGLSASNGGQPTYFTNAENASDIKFGSESSTVIPGFALLLKHMHIGESGRAMFVSGFGYGTSGSGKKIPGYSPLIFDVEVLGIKE